MIPTAQNSSAQHLIEGNPTSPVRVVIYEDLQCPDCAAFRQLLDSQLLPRFHSTVGFEHRDFPLTKHPWARPAAVASRFFEGISSELAVNFRKATMAAQEKITPETFDAHLSTFAKSHDTEAATAIHALDDAGLRLRVEADYREGVAGGVTGTPTVLVNGEPFSDPFAAEEVIKRLDREVAAQK